LPRQVKATVILPVYNEADLIVHSFDAVTDFAEQAPNFQFLFVDDGSSDDTAQILRRLLESRQLSNIRLLLCAKNAGKGRAIRTGIEQADGDLVIFTDGDLAYPLDQLGLLVEALQKHDVVIGSRGLGSLQQGNRNLMRHISGWGFNKLVRLMFSFPYQDTQAGLKGFRVEAARKIFSKQQIFDYAFDVEIIYLARRMGFTIAEVPVCVSEWHSYSKSKVNLLRDPLLMLASLLRIYLNGLNGRYGSPDSP